MRRHAAQLRLDQADRKYSASDGADRIRRQCQQQLPMLDEMVLDYYDCREQTIRCAHTVFGEGSEAASRWRKALCTTTIQPGPVDALTEPELPARRRRGRKRHALKMLQGYIAKRVEMLQYPRFLSDGLDIGSGPTQSQCKGLTARLKGRGRRCNRQGIDAHLAISCFYNHSNEWQTH